MGTDGIIDLAVGAANDGSSGGIVEPGAVHLIHLSPVVPTDTEISLVGGILTITDIDGGDSNDTLTISYSTPDYTISDGSLTLTTTIAGANGDGTSTLTIPDTGVNGISVDALGGNDTITVHDALPSLTGDLTINGSAGNDTVNLNANINFANNANLNIDLTNGATAGDVDQINVGTNAHLALTGNGAATLKASRNIDVASGASIETVNGRLTVEANQQEPPTAGNFSGVVLSGATLETTGDGDIVLTGRGGDDAGSDFHRGVGLLFGAIVRSNKIGDAAGTITINGTGGLGTGVNRGVEVYGTGSLVTSVDGDIQITGQGGNGTVNFNAGFILFGDATFANETSNPDGITGIMIDIGGLTGILSIDDFAFHSGNDNYPANWPVATPPMLTVREGEGDAGTDRITLTWAADSIVSQWLQVTIVENATKNLLADVFYFGNAVGEINSFGTDLPTPPLVNAADIIAIRDNPRGPENPALVDNPHDLNRDQRVDALDMILARNNATSSLSALRFITPPTANPAPLLPPSAEGQMFPPAGEGEPVFANGSSRLRDTASLDGLMATQADQPTAESLVLPPTLSKLLRRLGDR